MSGFVAVYCLDGHPVEKQDLDCMLDPITHRGPDGASQWMCGPVGLGHLMLWTTPESLHETMPLADGSGQVVLTADARVDNRNELISILGLSDHRADQVTDSQLILRAYLKWGEACVEKLIGDFAFALWDGRVQRLLCARDPMGIKPLYYFGSDRLIVVGSEIKALLGHPRVPRRLNETRVGDLIALTYEDVESTFYLGISRLPAAHSLVVDPAGCRKRRYWTPDPNRELCLRSEDDYANAMREVFSEAVRCRLRSAYPVGSMLSGGLDSSSIVCTARKILSEEGRPPLHTFSHIFPNLAEQFPQIDERPWIQAVIASGDLVPHYIRGDLVNPLEALLWSTDEPLPVANLYINWFAFSEAQREGIRVVFDGYDGDTVLAFGDGYLAELARSFQWRTLLTETKALADFRQISVRSAWWQDGMKYLLPSTMRRLWWMMKRYRPSFSPFNVPLSRTFSQRIDLERKVRARLPDPALLPQTTRESLCRSLTSGLFLSMVENFDKPAAIHSLEPRLPFLDRRLIEFCIAVPNSQKLRRGFSRFIMRRAMTGILPQKVQWRPNKGKLGANLKVALLRQNQAVLDNLILHRPQVIGEYLDVPRLQALYRRYTSSPLDSGGDELFSVSIAVTLDYWLRSSGFAKPDFLH